MKRVKPGEIDGRVRAPPSKSQTQRAVFLASLAEGESTILSASACDDATSAIRISSCLGAIVSAEDGMLRGSKPASGKLVVEGRSSKVTSAVLDCGESGFCARAAIPLAAVHRGKFTVTGHGTLARRPIGPVEAPMRSLGAKCRTTDGRLPVNVKGTMKGGRAELDGSSGSQFISGLLMALPSCPEDSQLSVSNLVSKPYLQMTIGMARKFGAKVMCDKELSAFAIDGGQKLKPARATVEGDWSGASFILVAGALAGRVAVENLNLKSLQADRAILGVLKDAGTKVKTLRGSVTVESAPLVGFDFDASDCPDLFPSLVALATGCKGLSSISGASRLRAKESDRAAALYRQFKGLGADIKVKDDAIVVRGSPLSTGVSRRFCLRGGTADSEGDHRIAMACAIAGLVSEKGVSIKNPECVSKSYPGFFGDLARLAVR